MMIRDDIRNFLRRLFLGKVTVRSHILGGRSIEVRSSEKKIEIRFLRSPERVLGTVLFGASMYASVKGFLPAETTFGALRENVRGGTVSFGSRLSVKGWKIIRDRSVFQRTVPVLSVHMQKGISRISSLPVELHNRLQWFRRRPVSSVAGEALLALYFPIMEDGVKKSVLNKESGSLLVWYNPLRARKTRGLLLVRNFSLGRGLEWRWIDIE
jgi:hypothetical protein